MGTGCEAQFLQLIQAALWNKSLLPTEQDFEEHFEGLSAGDTTAVYDVYKQAFFLAKSYIQADISKTCGEPQLPAKLQALSELCQQRARPAGSATGLQHPEQVAAQLRRKAKKSEVAKLNLALQEAQEQVEAAEAQLALQQQRLAEAVSQVEGKAEHLNKVSQASLQWNRRPAIST